MILNPEDSKFTSLDFARRQATHGGDQFFFHTKQEQKPMAHKHDALIREWLDKYDTHVVIYNSSSKEGWVMSAYPDFYSDSEYKLTPKKHLDVALAFYNDGVEVECLYEGRWVEHSIPLFSIGSDYRIKPKPQPKDGEIWMCLNVACERELPIVWDSTHFSYKPLYKMVRADD